MLRPAPRTLTNDPRPPSPHPHLIGDSVDGDQADESIERSEILSTSPVNPGAASEKSSAEKEPAARTFLFF